MPAHAFTPDSRPDNERKDLDISAIGILPDNQEINIVPRAALHIASKWLLDRGQDPNFAAIFNENPYVMRINKRNLAPNRTLVFRTILTDPGEYCVHLKIADWARVEPDEAIVDKIELRLNGLSRLWLVEVTEPDLYMGNRTKVIDILIDAKSSLTSPKDGEIDITRGVIGFRTPEWLYVFDKNGVPPEAFRLGSRVHRSLF